MAKQVSKPAAKLVTLSVNDRKHVDGVVSAGATVETCKATIGKHMLALFPSKAHFKERAKYKTVMKAIRDASNNGLAYREARAWCTATYGGLLTADGIIADKAHRERKGRKGMTAGRFSAAWLAKAEALTSYMAKAPKADLDPEVFGAMVEVIATLTATAQSVADFIESEKALADEAAA